MKYETQKKNWAQLKPYLWKKGQSGNPKGGKSIKRSMKEFVANYLSELSTEDKIEFLQKIDPAFAWRMAEGNPAQDLTSKGEQIIPIPILGDVQINNSYQENTRIEQKDQSNSGGDFGLKNDFNSFNPYTVRSNGQDADLD